MPLINCNIIS